MQYQRWLAQDKGVATRDYAELWRWSVEDIDRFWQSIWSYFDIQADGSRELDSGRRTMPVDEWFPDARLNFAEHVFRNRPAFAAHLIGGVGAVGCCTRCHLARLGREAR